MFPIILDMENANWALKRFLQESAIDRMAHFNISVAEKRRRDI